MQHLSGLILSLLIFSQPNAFPIQQELSSNPIPNAIFPNTDPQQDSTLHQWMYALNHQIQSLDTFYTQNAIKVNESGELIIGALAIAQSYKSQALQIDSIYTIKYIVAHTQRNIAYEIGAFRTYDRKTYKHLIIWDHSGKTPKRELEFVAEYSANKAETDKLNARRAEWIRRCNSHDAQQLIEALYTPNTIYYNHRPPIRGRDSLLRAYQYMNNESYQLSLNPTVVEWVSDTLVYEIGQCKGSYNGKYILIWQKNAGSEWQILMDSNI